MEIDKTDEYYLIAENIILEKGSGGLTEGFEALNYALSSDPEHCQALCLLGYVYAELMMQYDKAFEIFDKVIQINPTHIEVYPLYAEHLIWAEEFERAEVLINFAFKMKRADLSNLYRCKALIMEVKEEYKNALQYLQKAKKHCYENRHITFLTFEESRIIDKLEWQNQKDNDRKKAKDMNAKKALLIKEIM